MATVARENIGLLNDKIIIKVSKEDYLPTFEKKLKEYSKTVNMPGFRKGMVPTGVIKKMYGPSIYTDEVLKTVEKQLHSYLDVEKPDIFAQPLALDADIRKLDLNNPADYEFGFEIGLKPAFELPVLENAAVTFNKVNVTEQMVQEEVERMLEKSGKLTDHETIDSQDAILTVAATESDPEGNAIESGINGETTLPLKNLSSAALEQFLSKKKEDSLVIELATAFDQDKLQEFIKQLVPGEAQSPNDIKYLHIKILKIELQEKEELGEAFYDKVFPGAAIATEEEFRTRLAEEIQQYWDGQSHNQLQDQLYHYLLDETRIEFPAEFLKRWLQTSGEEIKTPEQAEEEFPTFSSQLKWTLISDKLVKENNLQVIPEEIKDSMRAEVMRYFGNMSLGDDTSWLDSYVDRMMKDEKQIDATYRRLLTDKIFRFAESQAKPVEKEVIPDELMAMQHHHHH